MVHSFIWPRRFARFRAPLLATLVLALAGCDSRESLDPTRSLGPDEGAELVALGEPATAAASFAGGIPFGMAAQPVTAFGQRFNGAKRTIGAGQLLNELADIRARGGRIVLMMAGNPRNYLDGGHFSLSKWKQRVDEFKGVNFSAYINDGTIIGHFLLDEPNDPRNWNGRPVSPAVVEEMAKYSKQLWPSLPTVVRVQPDYLDRDHRYLDAAWAQYLSRRGDVDDYIKRNVADAQQRGLALIVGLNVLAGGTPNGTKMTASEVEKWGSALLSSSYPCAFIMWQHSSSFLNGSGVGNAMDALRRKAESRSGKSCRA